VVDGAAFQTSTMTANSSLSYHGTPTSASRITSLDATGFSLGSTTITNTNAAVYYYWGVSGNSLLKTFQYTGAGGASKAVTGIGFKPNVLALRDTNNSVTNTGLFGTTDMLANAVNGLYVSAHDHTFDNTMFLSLDSDGFTAGASVATNTSTDIQWGYAFKAGINNNPTYGTVRIANRMVGPMAMRRNFRQPYWWPTVASLNVTSTQTIQWLARLTAATLQTIQGQARITAVTLQTSLGRARIQIVTLQTILGKSRITATALQTLLGKARITATTTRTILGKARVQETTT
jgi:hypothetical protein